MNLNADVTYAVTHTTMFVVGLGQFGPTLVVGSGNAVVRVNKMTLHDNVLEVELGSSHKVAVPLANITHMKLGSVS